MGMALVGLDGRWLKVNQVLCDLLGRTPSELTGTYFKDVTEEEYRERDLDVLGRLVAGETDFYHTEKRYVHKDGRDVWVLLGLSIVRDAEGQPVHFISQIQDITARKEAEAKLQQSEREQRELAAQLVAERTRLVAAQTVAKIGDWEVDFTTRTRSWSAETYRIFEAKEEDVHDLHAWFQGIVHPDDRETVNATARNSITKREPTVQQHRLLMPDGRTKFVEQRWQVIHDANGEPLRAAGTVQDITESAEAQEILSRSERDLQLAQSVSHTGSWEIIPDELVADDDRDLHWSDEQFRIFGLTPGSVNATQGLFFTLVHPDDRARVRTVFAAAFESGEPHEIEHRITWPDGTERHVHERAEFVSDEATRAVVRVIGTTQDITDRKRAEQTLLEQAEMLNLAHDAIVVGRCGDRVITFWNKGAEHLYGWTAMEAIGQRIDELLYPDGERYPNRHRGGECERRLSRRARPDREGWSQAGGERAG